MESTIDRSRMEELDGCLPRLSRYARFLCGQRTDDAEDLAQTAVAEWLSKPVNGLPVFVQLRQIVKSRYLDLMKAKETSNVRLGDDEGPPSEDGHDRLAVRQVLDQMSFEDRHVLWSFYGQGYTVDEIAEGMRVNPRTVKRRLASARLKFAAIYQEP